MTSKIIIYNISRPTFSLSASPVMGRGLEYCSKEEVCT